MPTSGGGPCRNRPSRSLRVLPIAIAVVGVYGMRRRVGAGLRTASRWMLRAFLPVTGGAAAIVLGAGAASAAVLTVTYTGAPNPTTATPLTWSVSQNTGAPMSCELDLGATVVAPLADCGPTVTYSVSGGPAGTYTLVAYGDTAANVLAGSNPKTLSSSVAVAPVAPTPTGMGGPSNNRAPQWSLGLPSGATGARTLATSGGTVVASADPCADPWTGNLGTAADGRYTLTVVARQGGLTSSPGTLTYPLDTTAPAAPTVTAPTSPSNDRTPTFGLTGVEAGATVGCTATGPNGVVPVSSCTTPSARLNLAGQPDGSYRLDVVVTDVAGNPSATASASYVLDVTPPPAPSVSAPPALTRSRAMTLTMSDTEAGASLTCVLTSPGGSTVFSGACPANGTFDTTGFVDGVYTLVVTATDGAGNRSSTSVSWQRDTTPPPAPVITGPSAPVKDRTPALQVSDAEPGVTFDCAVAGPSPAVITTCGTTTILDLTGATDGDYLVLMTATDAAGNSRSSTFTVTLDTTAPPAPVITGPTAAVNDRTPTLAVTDTEAGVTYTCAVSGPSAVSASTCGASTTLDLGSAADGDYLVSVTATDAAGNSSTTTFTVTFDTTAPPMPVVRAPASPAQGRTPSFSVSDAEAGVVYTCTVSGPSGATVRSGACPADGSFDTAGFGDGVYTLVVTATDAAGNSSSTTVTWTRDTVAPPAPTVTVATPTRSTAPTVTISDAEPTAVLTCFLAGPGGATVFSGGCPSDGVFDTSGFGDGVYTLRVPATDAAGNSSSTTVTWTRDTVAPPAPTVSAATPTRSTAPSVHVSHAEPTAVLTCLLTAPGGATVFSGGCPSDGVFDTSGFGDGVYT